MKEMEDKKRASLPLLHHYDTMTLELEEKDLSHIQNMVGHNIIASLWVSKGNLNLIHHLHLCCKK
jgi:hypothetical protein